MAAPTGSGWDASGKGDGITLSTLSISSDTAENTSDAWATVRGTKSYTTGGKVQFEVKVLTSIGLGIMIGLLDQATAGGAGLDSFVPANGARWYNNGIPFPGGSDFVFTQPFGGFSVAINDIFGVAVDLSAGKAWLYQNGVSLSGDAVAGTGETGTIASNHLACPSISLRSIGDKAQLITSGLSYPISGFSGWN